VALQLQQFPDAGGVARAAVASCLRLEEGPAPVGVGGQEDLDVRVARRPRVTQDAPRCPFVHVVQLSLQPVQRLTQRSAPHLGPARVQPRIAAAVAAPAFDPVSTAPGAVVAHFDVVRHRHTVEVRGVVGQLHPPFPRQRLDGGAHRHLAEAVMVPVRLAVGGDVDEQRTVAPRGGAGEAGGQCAPVVQQALERHGARNLRIVEEERDLAATAHGASVRARTVDAPIHDVFPVVSGAAHPGRLVRRQDGEADAVLGEHAQRAPVDGGLGQPHAVGPAPEAVHEVGDAPAHLRLLVAPAGQRHDAVAERLGERVAASEAALAVAVGVEESAVDGRPRAFHPGEQRRAEVEADVRVVVAQRRDPPVGVEQPGRGVGPVALCGDALIPVVVWSGRVLHLDRVEPGVLARRLVEVPVHAYVPLAIRPRHGARL